MADRDALVLKALDGALTPSEREELRGLAGDDPVLSELLQDPHGPQAETARLALAQRLATDAALSPRGSVRVLQWAGVAAATTGLFGLYLLPLGVPAMVSLALLGGGSAFAAGPWLVARVKNGDPYGKIDR
ncbi:MAG: hypothetical protein AAFZ18_07210 [Myxococcota bacterium]